MLIHLMERKYVFVEKGEEKMNVEKIVLNEKRNVTLVAYTQPVDGEFRHIAKRPAVLILPGGGYQMRSDREADPVAFPYLEAGYQAFILRYSVGADSVWPNPLDDYEQAMALIAERAEEWKVLTDKIVVIGFSAGGHLAACAATMSQHRPYAAILGYPVIEGDCAKVYQKTAPDVIAAVDENTCPCFVFATRNDNVVPVKNSIRLIDALEQKGILFESHIYSHGAHGYSVCNTSVQAAPEEFCNRVPHWVGDSIEWLKDIMGDFGNGQMRKPRFSRFINGNKEDVLNVDCTMAYLYSKPEAMKVLEPILSRGSSANVERGNNLDEGAIMQALQLMTFRQMSSMISLPKELVDQIDAQLRQIPNK